MAGRSACGRSSESPNVPPLLQQSNTTASHKNRKHHMAASRLAADDSRLPDTFAFYWTRPLGAPDTCRRWTLVRRGQRQQPSVWACPLRSWRDLEQAFQQQPNMSTLELEGGGDWHNLVQQQPTQWHTTIARLRQTCPCVERLVVLLNQDEDEHTDADSGQDIAVRLIQDMFFVSQSKHHNFHHLRKKQQPRLRHVEFLDKAISPRRFLDRLRLLSLPEFAKLGLESIRWDTNGLFWNEVDTATECETTEANNDAVTTCMLAQAWLGLIRQHQPLLRELTFLGAMGWNRLFGEGEERRIMLWRTLEQASCLEQVDLGVSIIDLDPKTELGEYMSFLRQLHWLQRLVGDFGKWKTRTTTHTKALAAGQVTAAALHVVEAWYVESNRPKVLFTPEEEEEKKKKHARTKKTKEESIAIEAPRRVGTSLTERLRQGYRVPRAAATATTNQPVARGRPFVAPTPSQRRISSLAQLLQNTTIENHDNNDDTGRNNRRAEAPPQPWQPAVAVAAGALHA